MEYKFTNYKKSEIISNHLKMGGKNPQGEEINVNNLYFTRNDKPWIGVMGEYHFVRDNRENWYRELCKMKAGGITIVATYIFWIYHEEEEGKFNFGGDRDLREFVKQAQKAGLEVCLRIGPWAHGECRNGGFPDWLMKKTYPLRDNNSEYMEKTKIFYEKIYNEVQGMFWEDGGNIVAIQFENELPNNGEHLMRLKELSLEIGFKAPIYTVTGWNGGKGGARIPLDEVLPVFGAYPEEPWAGHTNALPLSPNYVFCEARDSEAIGRDILNCVNEDGWKIPYERYPFATCEMGGGVQITHMRRPTINAMDVYAMSLAKFGSGNNLIGYYMYKGGINKIGKLSLLNESKESDYPNDCPAISYDFQAPLSEYGEIRESYRLLNMLHMFANDFGNILAPMGFTKAKKEAKSDDLSTFRYAMRTDGESGFVFVNHFQRLATLEDIKDAVIDTGSVKFPSIDVCGEIAFIMPFNITLDSNILEYATAQLLCKEGNTYFFTKINGIDAEYKFKNENAKKAENDEIFEYNGIKIVTVSWDKAKYLRKLSDRVYIGDGVDIYEENGEICSAEEGDYSYALWNGNEFEHFYVSKEYNASRIELIPCEAPFEIPYSYEMNIGGNRKHSWKKISVSGNDGFVEIYEKYDVAQIYANGELIADSFYYGKPWRLPAKLIYGKESFLVMSDLRDDFYKEF